MTPAWLLALAGQSALVAGIALAGLWLLRHRSPLDRAGWLKLTLALLLALPLRPLMPRVEVTVPHAVTQWLAPRPVHQVAPTPPSGERSVPFVPAPRHELSLLTSAYALGVAGLIAHLVLGLALLARWSAKARPLREGLWQAALTGSGTPPATRLLVSEHVRAPLSWGLRRPVILIDPASAARDHDAPAILAHEAAHILRGDWLTLMAARMVLAVFWFNPLVWILLRALVQQCEEAADARALTRCEPTSYAQTLMTCLAGRGKAHGMPANGMAAGHGLTRRVHQILDARPGDLLHRSRGLLLGLSAVPVAALMASGISFAQPADTLPLPPSGRIVHTDGAIPTRHSATDDQLTIRITSKDGHSVWTRRYKADKANTLPPPEPPVPPAFPAPPVPPAAPVPPLPPVLPAPSAFLSDAAVERAEAMAEAARERIQALAEARSEAARARAEAARDRAQALAEAAHERALAQNEARQARAQAAQARAEASAWTSLHPDRD